MSAKEYRELIIKLLKQVDQVKILKRLYISLVIATTKKEEPD